MGQFPLSKVVLWLLEEDSVTRVDFFSSGLSPLILAFKETKTKAAAMVATNKAAAASRLLVTWWDT